MQPRYNFRGIAANDEPFRGLARDISRATTVDEALVAAGWDWTVHKVPYVMQGKTKSLPSRYFAIVRGDNLHEIAPCSADYRPIQNRDLMTAFYAAAGTAGVRLSRSVVLYGGARLYATAEMQASFDLQFDTQGAKSVHLSESQVQGARHELDRTILEIVMSTGHEPGVKARISCRARRLLCENGSALIANMGSVAVVHRGRERGAPATFQADNVAAVLRRGLAAFNIYRRQAEILAETPSHPALDRAYVVQLLDNVAWEAIVAETQARITSARSTELTGTDLLNAVVEQTYTTKFETALQQRSLAAVLDAIQSQPAADLTRGTLWSTYNGVTYQVDHRAGRNLDAAVESSLFGGGDHIKHAAMDLALAYAEAAGNPNVRGGKVVH